MLGGRLVIAAVIALVTGAACVTAAGVGTSSQEDADLVVPMLLPGDAAIYLSGEKLDFPPGVYDTDDEQLILRFSEEPWFAPDGHMEPRMVLRQALLYQEWGLKVWLEGVDVLASKALIDSGGSTVTGWAFVEQTYAGSYQTYETRHVDPLMPFCGLVHSLQGGKVEANSTLSSPGCASDLVLATTSNGAATFEDGAGVRLVIDSTTSVPRSITADGKTWTLTAFARGQANGTLQARPPLPIEFRDGPSPDAAGVDQLFPYDEALAAALDGPAPNALRDYAASHAEAYIAEAAFTEIQDGGNHRYVWRLVASDGSGAAAVNVSREGSKLDVPQAGVSQAIAMVPVPVIQDLAAPPGPYPKAPPSSFPTLSSVQARWESNRVEVAPQPNAWGFAVVCGATCDEAETQTWYGLDLHRTLVTCGDAGEIEDPPRVDRLRPAGSALDSRSIDGGRRRPVHSIPHNGLAVLHRDSIQRSADRLGWHRFASC